MRRSSVFLLALGLTVVPAAWAQDSGTWRNTDPTCDDSVFAKTVQAVQKDQEQAQKDADAANDFLKKIKEGPRNASDKLLSCVDVAWPDLPFSGALPGIEEYIKKVGDKAVEQACNEMRDKVRQVDSVFKMPNLSLPKLNLPNIPNVPGLGGQGLNPLSGQGGQSLPVGNLGGPALPEAGAGAPEDGGLLDLIKPRGGVKR